MHKIRPKDLTSDDVAQVAIHLHVDDFGCGAIAIPGLVLVHHGIMDGANANDV